VFRDYFKGTAKSKSAFLSSLAPDDVDYISSVFAQREEEANGKGNAEAEPGGD
jgi:hypothetical protein